MRVRLLVEWARQLVTELLIMFLFVVVSIASFLLLLKLAWPTPKKASRANGTPFPSIPFWEIPLAILRGHSVNDVLDRYFQKTNSKALNMSLLGMSQLCIKDPEFAQHFYSKVDLYRKVPENFPIKLFRDFFGQNIASVGGDVWRRQRTLMNPSFKHAKIRSYEEGLRQAISTLLNAWDNMFAMQAENGSFTVDPLPWMQKMTLDALGLAIFGFDFEATRESSRSKNEMREAYYTIMSELFSNPLRFAIPFYNDLPLPSNWKLEQAMNRFSDGLSSMLSERRRDATRKEPQDLLDSLLLSHEANSLSDIELISNMKILFLAGHETTASTLAFALHYLAHYPTVQQRMYNEVLEVCGEEDLSFEHFKKLKYMSMFIKEVMRINPIVTVLPARTATEEDNFGDYHIPKGTKVSIYINGLQRSPDLWEEPSRFDPDRFLPELSCKRPTYAWSAFGGGPRVW